MRSGFLMAFLLSAPLSGAEGWEGSILPPGPKAWLEPSSLLGPQTPTLLRTDAELRVFHLYALAQVSEWPEAVFPDREAPFLIGVLGRDTLGSALESLESRTVQGRPIRILRSRNVLDLMRCQVVYIPPTEDQDLVPILRALRGHPVLTTGEHENHTQLGGIVRLILAEGTLRMEVNIRAAREAHLAFRSQFLKMVSRVAY